MGSIDELNERICPVVAKPTVERSGSEILGRVYWILDVPDPLVADRNRQLVCSRGFVADRPEALYQRLVSHCDDPARLVLGMEAEPSTPITDPDAWLDCPDFEQRMMYLDTLTYLPDDILVKVDRAAMGVSLEARVPLLDHRIVEFAWGCRWP